MICLDIGEEPGRARHPALAFLPPAAHNASNVATRSNRSSAPRRLMRLPPATDQPPGLVERTRCVLVTARVQVAEILRQPAQEPQLLDSEIRRRQMPPAVARVRRLDQPLQHVEGGRLQPVAQQELLPPRNFSTVGTSHSTKPCIDSTAGPVRSAPRSFPADDPTTAITGGSAPRDSRVNQASSTRENRGRRAECRRGT